MHFLCLFPLPVSLLLTGLGTLLILVLGSAVLPIATYCCCEIVLILCPAKDFAQGDALYCLLQPATSYLSMQNSSALGLGQEGLLTPTVLGINHPLVALLFKDSVDISSNPIFLPDIYITHNIDLIDPTS